MGIESKHPHYTNTQDKWQRIRDSFNGNDAIKGESESLGGLLLEINKNLPRSNEKIEVGKFLFSIESVDQKRIKRVRVFRKL